MEVCYAPRRDATAERRVQVTPGLTQSKKKTATKRHGYRRTSHHATPVPSKTSEHHPFRLFPHFKKTGRANQ